MPISERLAEVNSEAEQKRSSGETTSDPDRFKMSSDESSSDESSSDDNEEPNGGGLSAAHSGAVRRGPLRKAKEDQRSKHLPAIDQDSEGNLMNDLTDDQTCQRCGSGENEDRLLLCDRCDIAMHNYCVDLEDVPVEDWFCPECTKKNEMEIELLSNVAEVTKEQAFEALKICKFDVNDSMAYLKNSRRMNPADQSVGKVAPAG